MSDPDDIRADIERTRADLGTDVDALAEKVSPSSIAHRQTDKVKSRFAAAKEHVMGTASDLKSSGSSSASSAADSVKAAPHKAAEKAKGNPLAVGLIAFGAGWLASSLLPASDKEQELAATAKEKAAPLLDEAKSAAQNVAEDLKEPAQEAAQAVKDSATDSAETVKGEAQSAAGDVKSSAQDSRDSIQNS